MQFHKDLSWKINSPKILEHSKSSALLSIRCRTCSSPSVLSRWRRLDLKSLTSRRLSTRNLVHLFSSCLQRTYWAFTSDHSMWARKRNFCVSQRFKHRFLQQMDPNVLLLQKTTWMCLGLTIIVSAVILHFINKIAYKIRKMKTALQGKDSATKQPPSDDLLWTFRIFFQQGWFGTEVLFWDLAPSPLWKECSWQSLTSIVGLQLLHPILTTLRLECSSASTGSTRWPPQPSSPGTWWRWWQ